VIEDDRGRRYEPQLSTSGNDYGYGLPDERLRSVSIQSWTGEHPRQFRSIEGELSVFDRAEEHRFVVPIPARILPLDRQLGPVRLSVRKLRTAGRRTEAQFRLSWPTGVSVPLSGASTVRVYLRLENRLERVYAGYNAALGDGGEWNAEYTFNAEYETPTTALEVAVPVRSGPERKVAFRLENIVTPFGRPPRFRTAPLNMKPRPPVRTGQRSGLPGLPEEYVSPDGGALRLPSISGARMGETVSVQVSLSRRRPDGSWAAPRWVQLEGGSEPLRLESLAPGVYRVRMIAWGRRADGSLRRLPGGERKAEVTIARGTEAKF
jgi:hypothetical protein